MVVHLLLLLLLYTAVVTVHCRCCCTLLETPGVCCTLLLQASAAAAVHCCSCCAMLQALAADSTAGAVHSPSVNDGRSGCQLVLNGLPRRTDTFVVMNGVSYEGESVGCAGGAGAGEVLLLLLLSSLTDDFH